MCSSSRNSLRVYPFPFSDLFFKKRTKTSCILWLLLLLLLLLIGNVLVVVSLKFLCYSSLCFQLFEIIFVLLFSLKIIGGGMITFCCLLFSLYLSLFSLFPVCYPGNRNYFVRCGCCCSGFTSFSLPFFSYMLSLCSLLLAFEFFFRRIDFFLENEKNTTLSFERNRCIFLRSVSCFVHVFPCNFAWSDGGESFAWLR